MKAVPYSDKVEIDINEKQQHAKDIRFSKKHTANSIQMTSKPWATLVLDGTRYSFNAFNALLR